MGIEDVYQSVTEETPQPIQASITGQIPEWIAGSLYRNGPGKFEFGDTKCANWFDGMALIHRFHISQGAVTYQNRFVQSDAHRRNTKTDRIVVTEFGTAAYPDPCKNIFRRLFSYFSPFERTDNTNVNIYPVGESLYAATETNFIRKIDPTTLESPSKVDLKKVVSVNGATAHPHREKDGTVYNLGASYAGGTKYNIIKITPPAPGSEEFCEKAEIVAMIPSQSKGRFSYYHSFTMTKNYFLFMEQPLMWNIMKLASMKFSGKSPAQCLEYQSDLPTRFHIIDRKTGQKVNPEVSYQSEAFFAFHHTNAYEEDGFLVLDTCAYFDRKDNDAMMRDGFALKYIHEPGADEHLMENWKSRVIRIVLPLNLEGAETDSNLVTLSGTTATAVLQKSNIVRCEKDILFDSMFELPAINYWQMNGMKYRFVYALGIVKSFLDCVVKLDVTSRTALIWHEENAYPSEPIFLSSPDAKDEDDGVLLSLVVTAGEDRCAFLVVLDAKTMAELGRATVKVKVGAGTHGYFIAHPDN